MVGPHRRPHTRKSLHRCTVPSTVVRSSYQGGTVSYTPVQPERSRTVWALLIALVITAGCFNGHNGNGKGHHNSWSREELEALARMDLAIALSEKLIEDPAVSMADKAWLRQTIRDARLALRQYKDLRRRGVARAASLAVIGGASAGIVADDVTVVGVADNVSLAPLAIAAIVAYMVTDAAASHEALTQAWLQVAQRIREVGTTVDDIIHRTAPGRQADTGIMDEVYDMLGRMGLPKTRQNYCRALEILMNGVGKDTKREQRIKATQKYWGCRPSRHSRER